MLPIQDSRVCFSNGKWSAYCENCESLCLFANKAGALNMLNRGSCRHCKKDYRVTIDGVYKNSKDKWCSTCSVCGCEQAYTRYDHAKQSEISDWQCKACVAKAKGFSTNTPIGNEKRLYNKFKKSAGNRKIYWGITFKEFVGCYTGSCALTGWDLTMDYGNCTASFDRIDSKKPYELGNIQWVHTMVNMCKNKHSQEKFISMCKAVADKAK